MTLTQHGPNYSAFRFQELKKSLRERGIQTLARDRRQMIRDLRKADRDAEFRFLDLPPELRNMIYSDILVPSTQPDGFLYYYPSILRSCRQVYNEAAGLLDDRTHADIWLRVHNRRLDSTRNVEDAQYGLDICFRGTPICRTGWGLSLTDIKALSWPPLLARVQSITVKVDIIFEDHGPIHQLNEGIAINHALYWLYRHLLKQNSATALTVEMSPTGQTVDTLIQAVLSPVFALAAGFSSPVFILPGVSNTTITKIIDNVASFRALRELKEEVQLAKEVNAASRLFDAVGLEVYDSLLEGLQSRTLFQFVESESLRGHLIAIENDIDSIADCENAQLPAKIAPVRVRLGRMRHDRKLRKSAKETKKLRD